MATKITSTQAFQSGAKITGLPSSSANGEPVVHEQLSSLQGALVYQGSWNATTNSPAIPAAASGNKGHYYVVGVAGSTTINGINDWALTDWIVSNGTVWEKVDNSESGGSPSASETVAGVIEIATQAETDAGTPTGLAITTDKLAAWSNRKLKFAQTFGDGTLKTFTFTHNFNTQDVHVAVREVATQAGVITDWAAASVNTVTVTVDTTAAPATNSLRVVVLG